jgi:hypothetical protein
MWSAVQAAEHRSETGPDPEDNREEEPDGPCSFKLRAHFYPVEQGQQLERVQVNFKQRGIESGRGHRNCRKAGKQPEAGVLHEVAGNSRGVRPGPRAQLRQRLLLRVHGN